jgi:hypothetical protein
LPCRGGRVDPDAVRAIVVRIVEQFKPSASLEAGSSNFRGTRDEHDAGRLPPGRPGRGPLKS